MFSQSEQCNIALMRESESEMDFRDPSQLELRTSSVYN